MPRLPIPNGDDNAWGNILNDFLLVAHNNDGTLQIESTVASKADDSAVVHNTGNEVVAGTKTFSSSPIVPTPTLGSQAVNKTYVDSVSSSGAPDATTTTKGIVKLAGDLGGTADAPTVPGLSSKVSSASNVNTGGVGVFKQKTGVNLEFKGVNAGSSKVTVTDDTTNNEIDIDVAEASLTLANLGGNLPESRITNLTSDLSSKVSASSIGVAGGVASLDGTGKVPSSQLPATGSTARSFQFSNTGTLAAVTGTHRLYNDSGSAWTIQYVRASVGGAPAGQAVIIDIDINGTTIFTTQANRPTIAAAGNTSGKISNMDVTSVPNGNYLTVDIDQVGTTTAGTDLTVQVEVA